MINDGLPEDLDGAGLLVRDALAARQWEAYLSDRRANATAWPTPHLLGFGAWRRERWRASERDTLLLAVDQSRALWRSIVDDSSAGPDLLETSSAAAWALEARRLLHDAKVEWHRLRALPSEPDFRAFLDWSREHEARLAAHGWTDEPGAFAELARDDPGPRESLFLLDLDDLPPAFELWLGQHADAGWRVERLTAPLVESRARRLELADAEEELAVAAQWARAALDRRPEQRIAIVVPELRRHAEALTRHLRAALGGAHPFALKIAEPGRSHPVIAAALNGIELLSARGGFLTLSRWLRSPFYRESETARAAGARLEALLRQRMTSRMPFLQSWRSAGLRDEIEREDPDSAAKLGAALGILERGPRRAAAANWAGWLQLALNRLGWPARGSGIEDEVLALWDDTLARFTALTPMLGDMTIEAALAEIEGLLSRRGTTGRWPLRGVHVLEHVDEVGPGFGAVWVMGMTDLAWPERSRSNPLLPRRLQLEARLPWASPEDSQRRAQAATERLLRRAPEIVVSWPAQVYDFASDPSPLIAGLPAIGRADLDLGGPAAAPVRRPRERLADPAPPLRGERIPGGARTLNLQARCPLRAFCETRLGARELDALARGLDRRQQGIAVHRALELHVRAHPSQQAIAVAAGPEVIRHAVEQALREVFGAARGPLETLYLLEAARVTGLIVQLRELELRRSDFETVAVEERASISLGVHVVSCRVDRIDRVGEDRHWILDYKTGRGTNPADWFHERLGDTQLPLYALQIADTLAALAVVAVSGPEPSLRVLASDKAEWPGARTLPEGISWSEQIARWRGQLEELVVEYVRGDTRIFLDDSGAAEGAYAPLTRVWAVRRDLTTATVE